MRVPEIWGGAECTVNRVGDRFQDQFAATGHQSRFDDLDRLADLGLTALRFPVLWEKVALESPARRNWQWHDTWLARIRELGMRPIAGLVHHGSGPRYTSLVDDGFATGLADHALAVARRYPWVTDWTPVNEPLTTARFSALYGHWYPHARDERLFWVALLNQIDAVRLSMRAIRSVQPAARLIQTEDLGRTYATAEMASQAGFDNDRRWMTWDLLCGRVVAGHPLYLRLCRFGLERRLRAIADDPCPPDVVGINHYLTSDRFLDHRIDRYPAERHGGNSRQRFADVEAVRVLEPAPQGLRGAIEESWQRYGRTVAITEVHNGCTREEQLRWIDEAWRTACEARRDGVDLQAITMWALFGSQGWNTLLTAPGVYEAGAFDVGGASPRPTAIAAMIKSLTQGEARPRAAAGLGWWRRDIRFVHPRVQRPAPMRDYLDAAAPTAAARQPILITGATGTLGRAIAAACGHRDLAHVLTGRQQLDLSDANSIAAALDRYQPWAVVNTAGWVRVDEAERERGACFDVNDRGAVALAAACGERGIPTLSFSSDLVFDGAKGTYTEADETNALNVYGESKARMEQAILRLPGDHLVARTAAFFSPFDQANFAVHAAETLARGERFAAAGDYLVTPTYVPDLCNAALDLLIDSQAGIWHLSNGEAVSWAEFAVRVAQACGLDAGLVDAVPGETLGWLAARPRSCALATSKGLHLPSLQSALDRFSHVVAPRLAGLAAPDEAAACAEGLPCAEREAPAPAAAVAAAGLRPQRAA